LQTPWMRLDAVFRIYKHLCMYSRNAGADHPNACDAPADGGNRGLRRVRRGLRRERREWRSHGGCGDEDGTMEYRRGRSSGGDGTR